MWDTRNKTWVVGEWSWEKLSVSVFCFKNGNFKGTKNVTLNIQHLDLLVGEQQKLERLQTEWLLFDIRGPCIAIYYYNKTNEMH